MKTRNDKQIASAGDISEFAIPTHQSLPFSSSPCDTNIVTQLINAVIKLPVGTKCRFISSKEHNISRQNIYSLELSIQKYKVLFLSKLNLLMIIFCQLSTDLDSR